MAFASEMAAPSFRRVFAAAASPAASGLPQYSEDSPLHFHASSAHDDGVGVFCTGLNQFEVQVMIGGQRTRIPGFPSIATATEACRRMQDGMSPSPVAGAPELPRAPKPEPAPKPAPLPAPEPARAPQAAPTKRYKGVRPRLNGDFHAVLYVPGAKKGISCGTFATAEEAADAYDDAVRKAGGKVVNTPLHPDEVRAVSWRGMRKEKCAAELAPAPAAARDAPAAEPNKRKRGRPRKVIREDGAAAAVAADDATPAQLAAAAAAQFRGVTAISGGGGFFAWLSYCNTDGGLMRRMLGAFGTAEEAARAVDAAARRHSQLEQLNFPTPEELARMGRQTRSSPHQQTGRLAERKTLEDDGVDEDDEEEDEDDWQPRSTPRSTPRGTPRGTPRRRVQSPGQARRDADALAAPEQVESPRAEVPEAPAAPTPTPSQSQPVTPDPLALVVIEAPAPEAPLPPQQQQPKDEVVAFLRGIAPPLRCLDAAVAAAPGSGVTMRQLRQLPLLRHSTMVAACVDRVAAALRIDHAGDMLDLMVALDRLGP